MDSKITTRRAAVPQELKKYEDTVRGLLYGGTRERVFEAYEAMKRARANPGISAWAYDAGCECILGQLLSVEYEFCLGLKEQLDKNIRKA